MSLVRLFIKRLFCKHEYEFVRNIYGDEINMVNGRRSWWRCMKCGKWRAFKHLQPESDELEVEVDI